jgi:catechol 2,3-dioxygenase-like lactoylglutathione lyase family enzyme
MAGSWSARPQTERWPMLRRKVFLSIVAAGLISCASPIGRPMENSSHPLDSQLVGFSTMLVVRDLTVSERFYVDHLGFDVTERLDSLRRLERSGATIYLVLTSPPTADKPGITLAPHSEANRPAVNLIFRVRDVRQTHAALSAGGMPFLAPPQQPAWGGWRCFAQDPDGYLIEFEQP